MSLLPAALFDLCGWSLGVRLSDIFVSMMTLPKATTPPPLQRAMTIHTAYRLQKRYMSFFYVSLSQCKEHKIKDLIQECQRCLDDTKNWEQEYNNHLQMNRHIIESLGITAVIGLDFIEHHHRGRYFFSMLMLVHIAVLPVTMIFDYLASKSHHYGVGIVVNDVPDVPFQEKSESFRKH